MEKEEKISKLEAESFYGRLRQYFPYFALLVMSLLKVALKLGFGVEQQAYSMIYPILCLDLYGGIWGTCLITVLTQGLLIDVLLFGWESFMFQLAFCMLLSIAQLYFQEKKMQDAVL